MPRLGALLLLAPCFATAFTAVDAPARRGATRLRVALDDTAETAAPPSSDVAIRAALPEELMELATLRAVAFMDADALQNRRARAERIQHVYRTMQERRAVGSELFVAASAELAPASDDADGALAGFDEPPPEGWHMGMAAALPRWLSPLAGAPGGAAAAADDGDGDDAGASRIIGTIDCSTAEFALPTHSLADGMYLCALCVHPRARRRGVGRSLVEAAIDFARSRGVEALYLHVEPDNAAATALYADVFGFERFSDARFDMALGHRPGVASVQLMRLVLREEGA